jgi:hypothetical protein
VKIAMPKIHESVFDRIAVDAHLYAPVGLPPAYEILTYDEKIITPDKLTLPSGKPKYESLATGRQREFTQEHVVGSSIWRRRVIYFLTVIASIYLLTYPLTSTLPAHAEFASPLRPLSDVIRLVGLALPEAASRWINAYAREPLWFVLCASLVALLLWLSVSLRGRITDQMRRAWRVSLAKVDVHNGGSKIRAGAIGLPIAVFAALLLIALYPVPGWFGYDLPKATASPQTFINRITHPYFQFFAVVILTTMLLGDRAIARFRLKDAYRQFITNLKLEVAPAFFAVTFLIGGFALASHYVFNIRDSLGNFCQPAQQSVTLQVCDPAGRRRQLSRYLRFAGVPRRPPHRIQHRRPLHAGGRDARAARTVSVHSGEGRRLAISGRSFRPGWNAAPRIPSRLEEGRCARTSRRIGAVRFIGGGLSAQADARSALWTRYPPLRRDRQRGELHRRRTDQRPPR